jgi:hypothetical protein
MVVLVAEVAAVVFPATVLLLNVKRGTRISNF